MVWRRSIASVAIVTAVSKPKVKSVALRSLSMVLGDTHCGKPGVGQSRRHPESVFTTDGNKGIHAKRRHVLLDGVNTAVDLDGVGARRTQNGAATRKKPAHPAGYRVPR